MPYLIGRFEKGNEVEIPQRRQMKKKPADYLRHIYYDCIACNPVALQYLVSVAGPDHVMFGTDWPHQVHDIEGPYANTQQLAQAQREAIRCGNALKVFNIR